MSGGSEVAFYDGRSSKRVSASEPLPVIDRSIIDSAGNAINPDAYAQTLTYNGSNQVTTISFTDGTNTWTQTLTYTGGNLTGISKWVKS